MNNGTLSKRQNENFIDGVHGLRAAAALAVVFFHSGGAVGSEKYQGISWVAQVTSGLSSGVDLFFVISGFVIALPFLQGRKIRFSQFLIDRFLRIYPLSVLTAIIFIGSAWIVFGRAPTAETIYSSILLVPNGTDPVPIVLWTLKQELLFYVIFSLVFISPKIGISVLFAWSFASIIFTFDNYILQWAFNAHNIQFFFGVAAAFLFVRGAINRTAAIILASSSAIAFLFISYNVNLLPIEYPTALLGFFGAGSVLGVAFGRIVVTNIFMFIGTASYSIYLIHYFFVSLGNKTLMLLIPSAPGAVSLLLLTIFSTLAGCLYFFIFERMFESWRRSRRSSRC